jgi:flagellar FliJ protein
MRKKIFGLDQILNYRVEVEKLHRMEFTAVKQEYESEDHRLRSEEAEVERLNEEYVDKQLGGINAFEMQLYQNFFRKKDNDIKVQRQKVIGLEKEVADKREVLLGASKDKKILEGLKEKKVKHHEAGLAEKERAYLDELALRKGNGK